MNYKYRWLRNPRTTQERRMNFAEEVDSRKEQREHGYDQNYCNRKQLVRLKRQNRNLVDSYDDIPHHYEKSWKKRRKQRYYNMEEQTKVFCEIVNWSDLWKLREYCINHNIRYRYTTEDGDNFKFLYWYHKEIGISYILKGV